MEYDYTDLEWLNKEDYKNAQGTSYTRHDFDYDECDGNRLIMQFDGQEDQMTYWSDNINADEDEAPTNFGASNQLQKIWTDTENSKIAGKKVSVGGWHAEPNVQKVEVTPGYNDGGDIWGNTVEAQTVRDGLFIARGVEPADRSDNKFKVVVTDKAGNASAASEITGVGFDYDVKEKFWYDAMGNISKREKTFIYGNEQNPIIETTRYFYDDANRLLYVDLPSGDDQHYIYGPLGDRIAIEYGELTLDGEDFDEFIPTTEKTRKFINLGGSIIQEYDNSQTPVLKYEYVRAGGLGGGIGSILYQKDVSDGENTFWRYYHYNHKGDVYALTDHPADSNDVEELMALYEYDAWGKTIVQAHKANVNNEFKFSTKQHDKDTGLIYFGARYYDASIARWTQIDPAGLVDGYNQYSYVKNSPNNLNDPVGLKVITNPCTTTIHIGHNYDIYNYWKDNTADPDSFAAAWTCEANKLLAKNNMAGLKNAWIPGAPVTDRHVYWDPSHTVDWQIFWEMMWKSAVATVPNLCSRQKCCNQIVTVSLQAVGGWISPDNKYLVTKYVCQCNNYKVQWCALSNWQGAFGQ